MEKVKKRLYDAGVIPVSVIRNIEDVPHICEALCEGGIDVIEVTFRASGAEKVISEIKKRYPHMLVGGGTVLNEEQARMCKDSGAEFVVSPGLDACIVEYCLKNKMPVIPGCTTATEYHAAMRMGLEVLKFFPAEQSSGAEKIKALSAPFQNFKVIPTGGISMDKLDEYMSLPCVLACGGSYMVAERLIKDQMWEEIKKFTSMTVDKVKEVRRKCREW